MANAIPILRRRALAALPILAIIVVGTFLLLEAAPGDAVDAYVVSLAGSDADQIAAMRQQWGLDRSVSARLWLYVTALATGDLGYSVAFSRPVLNVVLERLPTTLLLMVSATLLSFSIGSLLGIVAGSKPGGWVDRLLSIGSLIIYAVPGFWLGLVLALAFAVQLRWLPLAGVESIASGKNGVARALDIAQHLVLPVLSLGLLYTALFLRTMRSGMAEVWRQDFVRALAARGLPRRTIVRHVARNALLPLITLLGVQTAAMIGGSVVIESVFAIPGFGRLAQEAVAQRDTPLLLGVILVSAIFVLWVNLAVDLTYAWLDPRIGNGAAT